MSEPSAALRSPSVGGKRSAAVVEHLGDAVDVLLDLLAQTARRAATSAAPVCCAGRGDDVLQACHLRADALGGLLAGGSRSAPGRLAASSRRRSSARRYGRRARGRRCSSRSSASASAASIAPSCWMTLPAIRSPELFRRSLRAGEPALDGLDPLVDLRRDAVAGRRKAVVGGAERRGRARPSAG